MKEFDFVVIGSGIAGLTFALKAAEKGSVALVTKRQVADSNTARAQGGVACVVSDEDSFDLHIRDTLVAGADLCNEEAVRAVVTEGPARIQELADRHLNLRSVAPTQFEDFDRLPMRPPQIVPPDAPDAIAALIEQVDVLDVPTGSTRSEQDGN